MPFWQNIPIRLVLFPFCLVFLYRRVDTSNWQSGWPISPSSYDPRHLGAVSPMLSVNPRPHYTLLVIPQRQNGEQWRIVLRLWIWIWICGLLIGFNRKPVWMCTFFFFLLRRGIIILGDSFKEKLIQLLRGWLRCYMPSMMIMKSSIVFYARICFLDQLC